MCSEEKIKKKQACFVTLQLPKADFLDLLILSVDECQGVCLFLT